MKVKLQVMIEETLKENFLKTCENVGLDMSEVVRVKIHQFIKENGGVKMNEYDELVEQLRESNDLTDEQVSYIKKELEDVEIEDYETLALRNTRTANDKFETIYQVVITDEDDNDRHLCYI